VEKKKSYDQESGGRIRRWTQEFPKVDAEMDSSKNTYNQKWRKRKQILAAEKGCKFCSKCSKIVSVDDGCPTCLFKKANKNKNTSMHKFIVQDRILVAGTITIQTRNMIFLPCWFVQSR